MLRGTTYIYRPAGLYAHCPVTAGAVPAYWAGRRSAGLLSGDVHHTPLTKAHTGRLLSVLAQGGYSPGHCM